MNQEIKEKIEELKKMKISVGLNYNLSSASSWDYNFFEFLISPMWDEKELLKNLSDRIDCFKERPWLSEFLDKEKGGHICDNCSYNSFKYQTIMESLNVPVKHSFCGKGRYDNVRNLEPISSCTDFKENI